MAGIPVVIATNGYGMAVKAVAGNAPVMTVATNGYGTPIVLSDNGAPFVVEGGAPPVEIPLRVASVENRIFAASESRTKTGCVVRWPHYLGTDLSDLVFSFNNWSNASGEILPGNTVTIEECAIENAVATVSVPVTFSGVRTKVLADGDTNIHSDAILPASFSLSQFSRGEQYWFKARLSVPTTAGKIPYSDRNRASVSNSQAHWYDPAVTTVSSTDTPGIYTATGTALEARNNGYCPILLGHPLVDGKSFIAIGDSIAALSGDTSNSVAKFGTGFIQRSMHDAGADTNPLPCMNFARVGNATAHYLGANTRWLPFRAYAKYAIEELGTNNIGTGGSPANVSAIQTDLQSIWTLLFSGGVEEIIRTKLLPRTATTDAWATTANQTPTLNWLTGNARDQLNDWFDTKVADNTLFASPDMDSTRDPTLPDRWVVTGAANYATADGTHPSSPLHEFMAIDTRAAIAALP